MLQCRQKSGTAILDKNDGSLRRFDLKPLPDFLNVTDDTVEECFGNPGDLSPMNPDLAVFQIDLFIAGPESWISLMDRSVNQATNSQEQRQ